MTEHELSVRITVEAPPSGVTWALQVGRDQLQVPSLHPAGLEFHTTVRVVRGTDGGLDFRGGAVQGPRLARFIYLTSGVRAGQSGSCWNRRAKVSLEGLRRLLDGPGALPRAVSAAIAGTARDGGPACASVPLLGSGWNAERM